MKLLKPGTWTPKNWNPWSVGFLKRWKVPEEIKVGDKLVFKWTSKANVYLYNGGDEGDYDACVKNSERGTMLAPTSRYGRSLTKAAHNRASSDTVPFLHLTPASKPLLAT
ncbi:hypothetical protein CLOM_g7050 [Closterium sp. NIES-68]|nr:hypothetical protein CLOM_g7050 [Closterium sp. NIES-68]GJP62389.1 hypothetical protein CLOP_g19460 [Closterium sp. NIES-67]